ARRTGASQGLTVIGLREPFEYSPPAAAHPRKDCQDDHDRHATTRSGHLRAGLLVLPDIRLRWGDGAHDAPATGPGRTDRGGPTSEGLGQDAALPLWLVTTRRARV